MTAKMRALLVGGLLSVVAGTSVVVWAPAVGTTQAAMVDAGVVTDYTPRRLACMVFIDGGYKEVRPLVAVSNALENGRRHTIWMRAAIPFRDQLADADQNCRDLGALTWAAASAEFNGLTTAESPGSCACHQPDAGACNYDAGTGAPSPGLGRNEYPPTTWSGPGCVAKPCGEIFGVPNWPPQCPR